jgi:ESS family glutamate:Na+ symporter
MAVASRPVGDTVLQADEGVDLDFLVGRSGAGVGRPSHWRAERRRGAPRGTLRGRGDAATLRAQGGAVAVNVDIWFTLALASAALVVGHLAVGRIAFLSRYSIPDAVVGGMLFAAIVTLLRAGRVTVEFDPSLLTPLNVMFFTTVGLSADARSLLRGGRLLLLFFAVVAGGLVLQNLVGVGLAKVFDLHPANGLMAGSITLSGGHGTAAAWGTKFVEERNVQGTIELGIAAATYGLVVGGLLGGPFAEWLMRRHGVRGTGESAQAKPAGDGAAPAEPLSAIRFVETLLLVFVSMAIGFALFRAIGQGAFTLPSFIWALLAGAVLRNVLSATGVYRVDDRALELVGALSLSLFLAMIIMTLKLWELLALAGPVAAILLVQTAMLLSYVALVTYRAMGRGYDAVLLSTGHLGFALGSTATAMVNVQAVAERHGHSPLAFLLIPVMGAFLIDLANALTIQGFLALPWFTW